MIIAYSFIAILIAWIWVDYFRLIDIFEKEKIKYFILTFLLGGSSVLIVYLIHYLLLDHFTFEMNGNPINDFLFCVFKIGVVEEFSKIIPFLLVYLLFKKQFNEPIDFLAIICISALGFSATENILYFYEYGPQIIGGRAILATVGHMFDTSLIAYGIIRYRFYHQKFSFFGVLFYFFLAALSHGIYDFWLMFEGISGGTLITIFYFFITISIFSVITNNAINNSSFFTYKIVINPNKVAGRILLYYGIVFIAQMILLTIEYNGVTAVSNFFYTLITSGIIVLISVVRLSRFKLIENRWNKIKIELPFKLMTNALIEIKGDGFNESFINTYYEEHFYLVPLSQRNTYLGYKRIAYIEKKLFLKNDETFFYIKVFEAGLSGNYDNYLMKAKTNGMTLVANKHPVVALLKFNSVEDLENTNLTMKNFQFVEWGYLKPHTKSTIEI